MCLHMSLDLAALREAFLAALVPLAVLPAADKAVGTSLLHGLDVVLADMCMKTLCIREHQATRFGTILDTPKTSDDSVAGLGSAA